MQGYISVEIPTKTYIKAYILHKLGDQPVMNTSDTIGHKLYDLLQHSLNERAYRFTTTLYPTKIKVYIPIATFRQRGHNLNESNVSNFNRFVELEIKQRFYQLMDDCMEILPNFTNNLPEIRRRLGIYEDDWSSDSMAKDYYRRRKRENKKLLYKKINTPAVR